MNIKNLISNYNEQLENLQELLKTATLKQKAIINNERETIEKSTFAEESILNKINKKEQERSLVLRNLIAKNGEPDTARANYTLDEVLTFVQSNSNVEEFEAFMNCRNQIRSEFENIKAVNSQNRFLIEQANSIVKQTLDVLLKSRKKPILDRRI
ncbi:MAG: flagellar protein FlgN [Melioribacteraceae bacterium]|nr:flagellar protein FlgN [Melioribacteraceae bacterium]